MPIARPIQKIQAIINPASGQPEPVLAGLNRAWGGGAVAWNVSITQDAGDGYRLARQAVEDGADAIAVYGGDGTVSEVAHALCGGRTPLAILPGGTGNAAAQELDIPLDLEAAARLAVDPNTRWGAVDLLKVRDRVSLLRIGIGFDAQTMNSATREWKDKLGWFAYPFAAIRELGNAEPGQVELVMDGEPYETPAFAVVLANVGRMGRAGARFPGDVNPSDGLMDVYVVRSMDLASLVTVAKRLLAGKETGDAGPTDPLLHFQCKDIEVRTLGAPMPLHIDGDPCGETPICVETLAGALPVLLPAESSPRG
ncbi:MAG: diacylglycerol kinase family lipid kinase [Planctomycetota bacterium]